MTTRCACALKVELPSTVSTLLYGRVVHGFHTCRRNAELPLGDRLNFVPAEKLVEPDPARRTCEKEGCTIAVEHGHAVPVAGYSAEEMAAEPVTCRCGHEVLHNTASHLINEHMDHGYQHCRRLRGFSAEEIAMMDDHANNARAHDPLPHEPFAGGGMREPQGDRARFELLLPRGVPFEEQLLTRFAQHMARGAQKYEDRNWEQFSDAEALERAKSSALRHMMQWVTSVDDGEDHAAAILFNVMAAEHVTRKLKLDAQAAAEMTEKKT